MGEFFATQGEDYMPTGWITNKGKFIKCSPFDHDKIAKKETGLTVAEVEKIWIRISLLLGRNHLQFEGRKLNKLHHRGLEKWGLYKLYEKGVQCSVSDNFRSAFDG